MVVFFVVGILYKSYSYNNRSNHSQYIYLCRSFKACAIFSKLQFILFLSSNNNYAQSEKEILLFMTFISFVIKSPLLVVVLIEYSPYMVMASKMKNKHTTTHFFHRINRAIQTNRT